MEMNNVNKKMLEALEHISGMPMDMYVNAGEAMCEAKRLANEAIEVVEQVQSSGAGWQCFNDGFKAGAEEMRDGLLQLCKDFSDRQNRPYMGDVLAQVDSLFDLIVSEIPRSLEHNAHPPAVAEPVAWQVRNGVVTHDFYKSKKEAEEAAHNLQKAHDLSGSLSAFNVRPVYANPSTVTVPDGYVLVPDAGNMNKQMLKVLRNDRYYYNSEYELYEELLYAATKGGA